MSSRLRCPACGDRVPEPVPGRPVVCPGCGARLSPKQRARPTQEAGPVGGPRKRPRPRQRTDQGLPVLVWVIPVAAVGVLAIAAVGGLLLWLALARPRPVPGTAGA